VSPAKTAELSEMPYGVWAWVGPKNHVLDGGPDPPWEGAVLCGKGRPISKYRECHPCVAAMRPFVRLL